MNVFDISAKIGLDTSEYVNSLNEASNEANSFGDKIKGAFSASMKIGAEAVGIVANGVTDLSKALMNGVNELASYGDHIDKQSQKMNMSAQAYQEWDAIMQHSGTSIDSMQASMKTLANAAESDNEAFTALGMSLEDVKQMSREELFSNTITALQNVESDTHRAYLASQLLGRGATELGALLNTSAEDTEKMRQRVHELGGVMSDEAVKNAAKYKDALQDMKTAMSGVARGIVTDFVPSFTEAMEGITSIVAGEEGGTEKLAKSVNDILSNLINSVRPAKSVLTNIGSVMLQTIKENAPKILQVSTRLMANIIKDTVKNLPEIIATVGDSLSGIGEALIGYLPDWLGDDISRIFGSIKDFISGIDFATLKDKMSSLGDSLSDFGERVSSSIAWAFENVLKPLGTWVMNDALPVAMDVIKGVIDGISATLDILAPVGKAAWDNFFSPLFSAIGDLAVGSFKIFGDVLSGIAETFKGFDTSGFIEDTMNGNFWDNWKEGMSIIGETLDTFGDDIDEFFRGPGAVWNSFWQTVGSVMFDVKEKVVGALDAIAGAIDKVGTSIKNYPGFFEGFGEYIYDKIHGEDIPAFGDGGRVTRPTLALVGEKEPETIVPDSKRDQFGSSQVYITINVEGGISSDYDVERIANKLADLNIFQTRAIGGTGY